MATQTTMVRLSNAGINRYLNNSIRSVERFNARFASDVKQAAGYAFDAILGAVEAMDWANIKTEEDFSKVIATVTQLYKETCDLNKITPAEEAAPSRILGQLTTRFISQYLSDEAFLGIPNEHIINAADYLCNFALSTLSINLGVNEPPKWVTTVDEHIQPWGLFMLCMKLFYTPISGAQNDQPKPAGRT